MSAYRIVLADDHILFREGLKRILGELPDLEIIGEAANRLPQNFMAARSEISVAQNHRPEKSNRSR